MKRHQNPGWLIFRLGWLENYRNSVLSKLIFGQKIDLKSNAHYIESPILSKNSYIKPNSIVSIFWLKLRGQILMWANFGKSNNFHCQCEHFLEKFWIQILIWAHFGKNNKFISMWAFFDKCLSDTNVSIFW